MPVSAIIVGAGHRAMLYASYAKLHPEALTIVGVADPDPIRRKKAAACYHIPQDMCFESAEALAARPKLADAIINGTMDTQHVCHGHSPAPRRIPHAVGKALRGQ